MSIWSLHSHLGTGRAGTTVRRGGVKGPTRIGQGGGEGGNARGLGFHSKQEAAHRAGPGGSPGGEQGSEETPPPPRAPPEGKPRGGAAATPGDSLPTLLGQFEGGALGKLLHAEVSPSGRAQLTESLEGEARTSWPLSCSGPHPWELLFSTSHQKKGKKLLTGGAKMWGKTGASGQAEVKILSG